MFVLVTLSVAVVQLVAFSTAFQPSNELAFIARSTNRDTEDHVAVSQQTASRNRKHTHCPDTNVLWRIVLSGNIAYDADFVNWYYLCQRAGVCPGKTLPSHSSDGNTGNGFADGACPPLRPAEVVLYAEDVPMYDKYESATLVRLERAWDVGSKYNDTTITGDGRFVYSDAKRFRHMMSRRPSILLKELLQAASINQAASEAGRKDRVQLLFMDIDTVMLKDPRPYFVGDYDFWAADSLSEWTGPYNAGLLAMRASDASIDCVRRWRAYLEKREKPKTNQATFNYVVRRMGDGITHMMLDRTDFPVGKMLLDLGIDALDEKTLDERTVVLHNNWCEKGCSKPDRLKRMGLWWDSPPVNLFASGDS